MGNGIGVNGPVNSLNLGSDRADFDPIQTSRQRSRGVNPLVRTVTKGGDLMGRYVIHEMVIDADDLYG